MDWSEARAIITGGASGLGRAVAQEILKVGGLVAILDIDKNMSDSFLATQKSSSQSNLIAIQTEQLSV